MPKPAKTSRAFIAIELDANVRERLKEVQDQLKELPLDITWVTPEIIHLTLRFLGEISDKKLKAVKTNLPDFVKTVSPFTFAITSLGAFPSPQKPKVIWAGVNETNGELSLLAEKIETGVNQCGIGKEDKEFSAHITIGRVKSLKNISRLAETIPGFAISPALEQPVHSITLFKSTLKSDGPVYEVLERVALK